ncbi:hypothetical protein [Bosea caraganae]|nr:hypothetical protein [Bosea caraganae]
MTQDRHGLRAGSSVLAAEPVGNTPAELEALRQGERFTIPAYGFAA